MYGKIAVFKAGAQRAFVEKVLSRLSVSEIARISKRSERTIRDWRREKFSMDEDVLKKLCAHLRVPVPRNFSTKERYEHMSRAASKAGEIVWKKYGRIGGDEEKRLRQWQKWWQTKGKFKTTGCIHAPLGIQKPRYSIELAELCGILMGDGGISERQVSVTLHSIDDKEYTVFVANLMERLFGVRPALYSKKGVNAHVLVISRTELVSFLTEQCGLVKGNKIAQELDIPAWVRTKRSYMIACLRGLVDTDGSIFTHRYKVKGKWYSYKKLSFTSASPRLRTTVLMFLKSLGFSSRIGSQRDVRLDSVADMKKYFALVGSHNPKHLYRYAR